MNFVIFPIFFTSTALYPLWRMQDANPVLAQICAINPFTHAVELIRFALYGRLNSLSLAVVAGTFAVLMAAAVWGYDPSRGFMARKGD